MGTSERFYHLDWVRVWGISVVFIYHAARIFDPLFWYGTFEVRNAQTSSLFAVFDFGITFWLMPIFFLIAGASSSFSLSRRTSGQFIYERVKRLLVPFLFYLVVLIPPQLYMESVQAKTFQGSFFSFLPTAFQHIGLDLSNPHIITFPHKHLWFLWYLFFMSVISLPVLRWLSAETGKALIGRLARLAENSKTIFLYFAPLAIIRVALAPTFPKYQDYDDFVYWTLLVIYGFILYSDKRFEEAMAKERWNAFFVGVACYAGFALLGAGGRFVALFEHPAHQPQSVLFEIFWCLNAWSWLIFFLSTAKKYFNHASKFLSYANEALLPFYILHKTVILIIAFNMAALPMNLYAKFIVLLILSFAGTMFLYECIVRRVNILRVLSGMTVKKKQIQ